MKNTTDTSDVTVQFDSGSVIFPSWLEKLWMVNRPTIVSPSAEKQQAQKVNNTLFGKFIISMTIIVLSLLVCCVFYKSKHVSERLLFIAGSVSAVVLSFHITRLLDKLAGIKTLKGSQKALETE